MLNPNIFSSPPEIPSNLFDRPRDLQEIWADANLNELPENLGEMPDKEWKNWLKEKTKESKEIEVKYDPFDMTIQEVEDAFGDIVNGFRENLRVQSKDDAIEVFDNLMDLFEEKGFKKYTNTTGMSATEAKEKFKGKAGTYHWDYEDTMHGLPHVQIHTDANHIKEKGVIIRIFFESKKD